MVPRPCSLTGVVAVLANMMNVGEGSAKRTTCIKGLFWLQYEAKI